MSKPTITIVTVCFNCANELEKTILSVVNQTYPNIEYTIVDGASNDGTKDVLARYAGRISRIVSEPDKGVYDAMNKGIVLASGEWINFMNAGDYFADEKAIEEFFNLVDSKTSGEILYGDTIVRYPFGTYYLTAENGHWFHQSVFTKTSLMKRYKFNLHYRICADDDFFKRAVKEGAVMKYVPRVVSNYDHTDGLSSTRNRVMFLERSELNQVKKSMGWYLKLAIVNVKEYADKILKIRKRTWYKNHILKKQKYMVESNPNMRLIK